MDEKSKILVLFGQRVRQRRKALGMSQEHFALKCGLDRTYISGIERGKRNVGLQNVKIIADVLGITIAELFKDL